MANSLLEGTITEIVKMGGINGINLYLVSLNGTKNVVLDSTTLFNAAQSMGNKVKGGIPVEKLISERLKGKKMSIIIQG